MLWIGDIRVAQRLQHRVHGRRGEGVAAEQIDVLVAERGQPGGIGVGDRPPSGAQSAHGDVHVSGVPQHPGSISVCLGHGMVLRSHSLIGSSAVRV